MARKGEQFAGLTVALVTPFRDRVVDEPALRKLVDWHVQVGTDCVSPVNEKLIAVEPVETGADQSPPPLIDELTS